VQLALRSLLLPLAALALGACNLVFGIQPGQAGTLGTSGGGAGACGTGGATSASALAWMHGIAAPGPNADNTVVSANAVALGPDGAIVVTGQYTDTISLGSGATFPYSGDPSSQTPNVFLASYTPADGLSWAKGFDGPDSQRGLDVAVDAATGDIVVTGELSGSADLGLGTLTSAGGEDILVARYTKDGTPMWAKRFGDGTDQVGVKVAFDPQGNVILAALGGGLVDFGNGTPVGAGDGAEGVYLAELDAAGGYKWARWWETGDFPATGTSVRLGVAVDAGGTIVFTGPNGGADMSVLGQPVDPFHGGNDLFLMALDPTGALLWSHLYGGTAPPAQNGDQWGNSVAFGPCGDIFVTGAFEASLQIGSLPALVNKEPLSPDNSTADIFVARFRSDGTPVWALSFGDGGEQEGDNISLDGQGNLLVTGSLFDDANSKGIDFGDGHVWPPSGLSGEKDYRGDAFLVRLSGDAGETRFSKRMGDRENQFALGSTTDAAGNIVVVGENDSTMKYDNSALGTLMAGFGDMFVLRAGP
jgi:hypothetical protein